VLQSSNNESFLAEASAYNPIFQTISAVQGIPR
jgi:hypothetical protein